MYIYIIPGRVIPKTQKMVLDTFLLNNQHYKVWVKGKWNNPGKRVVPSLHHDVVAYEKRAFGSPLTTVAKFTYISINFNWTFIDTNSEIKKNHTAIKIVFTIKARNKNYCNHDLSPEEGHQA